MMTGINWRQRRRAADNDRAWDSQYDRRFRKRLRDWDAGRIELTEEEAQRYEAGVDPDVILVTKYLMGELSEEEEARVELRFAQDLTFYNAHWPLVELWDADASSTAEPPSGQKVPEPGLEPRRVLISMSPITALVMVLALLLGAWAVRAQVRAAASRGPLGQLARDAAGTAVRAAIAPYEVRSWRRDTLVTFKNVQILVRKNSRLRYDPVTALDGVGEYHLEGEAVFVTTGARITVITDAATVTATDARFAVWSSGEGMETRLVVGEGTVLLKPRNGDRPARIVRPGMRYVVAGLAPGEAPPQPGKNAVPYFPSPVMPKTP